MQTRRTVAALAAVLAILALGSMCVAQAPAPEAKATSAPAGALADAWNNMVHGIKVARPELVKSNADAILSSGAQPREIYLLAVQTPEWQSLLSRGAKLEGLKEPMERIRAMVEKGYEAERTDPAQIRNAINMLGQGTRAYGIALDRLKLSGEFAMPALVQTLADPKASDQVKERVVNVLPQLGKDAVRPLAAAMETSDPNLKVIFANALAQISYPFAAPALKEASIDAAALEKVREAATRALVAVAGQAAKDKSLADISYDVAEKYYNHAESLMPDVRYDKANVWYWKEGLGLDYVAVPREIFADVYAMRLARKALAADPKYYPALSLWVAADLRKEADMPAGATDPTMAEGQQSATFYALAAGSGTLQDVLARALKDDSVPVALGAIKALARTAGAKNLAAATPGGVQPLVKALSYPDRNVRFLAAVTLASALPDQKFAGSDVVMFVLNEAVRKGGEKTAVLIDADADANAVKDAVMAAGYKVVVEPDINKALAAARESAGVDVVVVGANSSPADLLAAMRKDPMFMGLPVVVVGDSARFRPLAQSDARVKLLDKVSNESVAAVLAEAVKVGAGAPMEAQVAADWSVRASEAVYMLALTKNEVFDVGRILATLVAATNDERANVRLAAAKALSAIQSAQAQQAIAALAVNAKADEKVRVEAFNHLSNSLRKFGNQLTEAQSQAVLDVVIGKGSPELREAAAQASGAMSLPSDKAKALVLETTAK
jgi:HEAT repeat protein